VVCWLFDLFVCCCGGVMEVMGVVDVVGDVLGLLWFVGYLICLFVIVVV